MENHFLQRTSGFFKNVIFSFLLICCTCITTQVEYLKYGEAQWALQKCFWNDTEICRHSTCTWNYTSLFTALYISTKKTEDHLSLLIIHSSVVTWSICDQKEDCLDHMLLWSELFPNQERSWAAFHTCRKQKRNILLIFIYDYDYYFTMNMEENLYIHYRQWCKQLQKHSTRYEKNTQKNLSNIIIFHNMYVKYR